MNCWNIEFSWCIRRICCIDKQLSALRNELNRIHEYQQILKAYRDTKLDIKASMIEQDKATDLYLEENNVYLDTLRTNFGNMQSGFIRRKRRSCYKNNSGENTLRYSLEARIEDDSSDGVNEVRMFCFDWLLLNCQVSKINL